MITTCFGSSCAFIQPSYPDPETFTQDALDDTSWLRDVESPEVRSPPAGSSRDSRSQVKQLLDAENEYTAGYLQLSQPLQAELYEEMVGFRNEAQPVIHPPEPTNGEWLYYHKVCHTTDHNTKHYSTPY